MFTVLLCIINFIIILGIIKLITSKFSKYIINKFTINDSKFNYIKKIQSRFTNTVMYLDLLFFSLFMYTKSTTILAIMTIINIILIISLGSFSKLQSSLDK
jgi:hypothetical protein